MKRVSTPHKLAVALILTFTSACDNVDWGGVDVAFVPPPPRAAGDVVVTGEPGSLRMPEGPVLFHVTHAAGRATMVPVGEIVGDSMLPLSPGDEPDRFAEHFIADRMRQGAEFALYRFGVRVGTFVVQAAEPGAGGGCPGIPRATGLLELTAGAADTPEFLAIAKAHAPATRRRGAETLAPERRMQILGPILAERMLRTRRAQLPGNWQRAMVQLQPIPLGDRPDNAFAATFLLGDQLGLGTTGEVAWSLFFVAHPSQAGYDTAFVRFANYPADGKSAPRIVDFLDWTRDGEVEVLLQVYGTDRSWFEAVGRTGHRWRQIFQDACPRQLDAPPAAGDDEDAAAAGAEPGAQQPASPPQQQQEPRVLGRPST
jgi:hypothetical protein